MRLWLTVAGWFALVSVCFPGPVASVAHTQSEYDVQLAYLFNFARFTAWRDTDEADTFVVCLIGTNPFGARLGQLAGRRVHDKPIEVRQLSGDAWAGCRMLYISASERQRLPALLAALDEHGAGILTVSDVPGFVGQGGMVQLFLDGESVRFALDRERLSSARLHMQAQLQQLARQPPGAN